MNLQICAGNELCDLSVSLCGRGHCGWSCMVVYVL